MKHLNDFERGALALGVRRLFCEDKFFSINQFDQLLELAGISITKEERKAFAVLHCVHYSEMPPTFRDELHLRVIAIFQRRQDPRFDVMAIFFPPAPLPREHAGAGDNFIRRVRALLGAAREDQ